MNTPKETIQLVCPRCGIAMRADVWSTYHWQEKESPKKPSLSQFAVCSNCSEPFLVETYEDRSKLFESMSVENEAKGTLGTSWRWEKLYPVEKIPGAPEHLPDDVQAFYIEAVGCLVSGYPNAAGAMFRKTLEVATKTRSIASRVPVEQQQKYATAMLSARLKHLKDAQIIPESLFELVDTIKLEGNEAVHGTASYEIAEAEALKAFLDAFLQFVFTFPKKLQSVRTAASKISIGKQ